MSLAFKDHFCSGEIIVTDFLFVDGVERICDDCNDEIHEDHEKDYLASTKSNPGEDHENQ